MTALLALFCRRHFDPDLPVDFCRCVNPQPVPVRLWGHVVVPGVFECANCGRGFDPATYEAVEL